MTFRLNVGLVSALAASLAAKAQYTTTVDPNNLPLESQPDQSGYNQCGTGNNQTSLCQNLYVNSVNDFCLWAPQEPGSAVGSFEETVVAWCSQPGRGTRLIPEGTITGLHFVETPDYIQLTGIGDLTKLNILAGDAGGGGGELDPHGADGLGNPHGGLVFSNVWNAGTNSLGEQIHEWTNFMAAEEFCIRVCKPGGRDTEFCQHTYDVMGCAWNMPGNYQEGFTSCQGDSGIPMGEYIQPDGSTSTWSQEQTVTNTVLPSAQPTPATSACQTLQSADVFAPGVAPTTTAAPTTITTSRSTTFTTSRVTTAPTSRRSTTSNSLRASTTSTNTNGDNNPNSASSSVPHSFTVLSVLGAGLVASIFL